MVQADDDMVNNDAREEERNEPPTIGKLRDTTEDNMVICFVGNYRKRISLLKCESVVAFMSPPLYFIALV